jgi:hypothetical protein
MQNKLILFFLSFALALALTGCGPSKAELAAKERQRLELEEQARRDAEKANKAITEMNKKAFGRKPPSLDLGLPAEKRPEPAPESIPELATKPAPKS